MENLKPQSVTMDGVCYYLKNGLWTVAEALYLDILNSGDDKLISQARDLFWSLANTSHDKCMPMTPMLKTPLEQSFMSSAILLHPKSKLCTQFPSTSNVELLKKEIEFKFFLQQINPSHIVKKELILHYQGVLRADKSFSNICALSAEAIAFLKLSLLNQPGITHGIIQMLLCLWCCHYSVPDAQLQNLYRDTMEQCCVIHDNSCNCAGCTDPKVTLCTPDPTSGETIQEQEQNFRISKLLCLISLFEVSEQVENNIIHWLFPILLNLCKNGILSKKLLYFALISRSSIKLLKLYIHFEDTHHHRNIEIKSINTIKSICDYIIDGDGKLNLEELFLRVLKTHRHWVLDIVDLLSLLFMNGFHENVLMYLSLPVLENFWFILLVNVWQKFPEHSNVFAMLQLLINCRKDKRNVYFEEVERTVKRLQNLKMWYANTRKFMNLKNAEILELAQQFSVLKVLTKTCNLAKCDWEQVLTLLHSEHCQDELHCSDQQGKVCDHSSCHWDVAIFKGFCTTIAALQAIEYSCEIERKCKTVQQGRKLSISSNMIVQVLTNANTSSDVNNQLLEAVNMQPQEITTYRNLYQENVTKKFTFIKKTMSEIYPLNFRTEILENLFSLLFLQACELCDENSTDSDMEEEPESDRSLLCDEQSPENVFSSGEVSLNFQDNLKDITENIQRTSVSLNIREQKGVNLEKAPSISLPDTILYSTKPRKTLTCLNRQKSVVVKKKVKSEVKKNGFLCNELVVRDFLNCLQECLVDMNEVSQNSHTKCESLLYNDMVPSVIKQEHLQERIIRLSEYVNKASWKMQLLMDNSFLKEVGYFSFKQAEVQKENWYIYTKMDVNDSESETETDRSRRKLSRHSSRRSAKSQSGTDKSSESGSQSTPNAGTGGKKDKKIHHNCALLEKCDCGIMNKLLSPPESLVALCLANKDIQSAKEVVQVFGMQDSPLAVEVQFTEATQILKKAFYSNLESLKSYLTQPKVRQVNDFNERTSDTPGTPVLQKIRRAASAGMLSTSLTSEVERFLSITSLPVVSELERILLDYPQLSNSLQMAKKPTAVVAVDFALTSGESYQQSVSLLDLACKHCPALHTTCNQESGHNKYPPGFVVFTSNIINLMKLINREIQDPYMNRIFPYDLSVPHLLTNAIFPLNIKHAKEYLLFWKTFHLSLKTFMENLEIAKQTSVSTSGLIQPGQSLAHFSNLSKVCSNFPLLKDSSKNVSFTESQEHIYYINMVLEYVEYLNFHLGKKSSDETEISDHTTCFGLFEDDLETLFGRQLFSNHVKPVELESVTASIGYDLLNAVVHHCCPSITHFHLTKTSHLSTQWGKIILNVTTKDITLESTDEKNPEIVVRNKLNSLIDLIQETVSGDVCVIDSKLASKILKNSSVTELLNTTSEFAAFDLHLITSSNELLAFYLNLTNLLWFHAIIFLEFELGNVNNCETLGLLSQCNLKKYLAQKSVGYICGQFGFVSLFSLQYELLRNFGYPFVHSLRHFLSADEGDLTGKLPRKIELSVDSRVLFCLINGQKLSPKLQAVNPNQIDVQLERSMQEYLQQNICVQNSCTVVIPEVVQWHQEAVLLNQEPESSSTLSPFPKALAKNHFSDIDSDSRSITSREKMSILLEFLRDNTCNPVKQQIESLLHDDVDVAIHICNISEEPTVVLKYSDVMDINILTKGNVYEGFKLCCIPDAVQDYLEEKCWVIAYLIKRLNETAVDSVNVPPVKTDPRFIVFERIVKSSRVQTLKVLFQNNAVLTALYCEPDFNLLWDKLSVLLKDRQWKNAYQIIQALQSANVQLDLKLQSLNDLILYEMASILPNTDQICPWSFCEQIGNISVQTECVLNNIVQWHGDACLKQMSLILRDKRVKQELPSKKYFELKEKYQEVLIFHQVLHFCKSDTIKNWHDVYVLSNNNPEAVLQKLLISKQNKLCLQWASVMNIQQKYQNLIDTNFVLLFFDPEPSDFSLIAKLLISLIPAHAAVICTGLAKNLHSIPSLKFVINFALEHLNMVMTDEESQVYKAMTIGLELLEEIPLKERIIFWDLLGKPELIVEQLLMNTKLELLSRGLKRIDSHVTEKFKNVVNSLLLQYGHHALEMKIVQVSQHDSGRFFTSLNSEASYHDDSVFKIPDNPPRKEDWVKDDQITLCMCCSAVTFSMFHRRHHCRRCGRVVCWSCSSKKILVAGYSEVPVRVCNDCFEFSNKSFDSPRTSKGSKISSDSLDSIPQFEWMLTSDERRNSTIRDEFSYEYAPSVSLCLAIMKLHFDESSYPRFLSDSCHHLLQLIQPCSPGMINPEVDYNLIIRIVRNLAVAAKVQYGRLSQPMGVASCDAFLSQVDLLGMLVEAGFPELIPTEPLSPSCLARLRDRLVEQEMWNLALNISNKAGLSRAGVWAAWGKVCLKAGMWPEARERFSHCLKPGRPQRSPPLLKDILEILESSSYSTDTTGFKHPMTSKFSQMINKHSLGTSVDSTLTMQSSNTEDIQLDFPIGAQPSRTFALDDKLKVKGLKSYKFVCLSPASSPALAVMHTLASLKDVSQGKYYDTSPATDAVIVGPKLDSLFYQECKYYVTTYGSHAGIISFYLKHDDMTASLKYIIEQNVDCDTFLEVMYFPCLKQGNVDFLLEQMRAIDCSLECWKNYIMHACAYLQKHSYYHCLYQLQVLARDHIRSAISCIKFYSREAQTYTDLASAEEKLLKAKAHMENALFARSTEIPSFAMEMKTDKIKFFLQMIQLQMEVVEFLRICEGRGVNVRNIMPYLLKLPTLFGNSQEQTQIAVLVMLSGCSISEGFHLSCRIIEEYHLQPSLIFSMAGKSLVSSSRIAEVEKLAMSIRGSGLLNASHLCDEMLLTCVEILQVGSPEVESVVKLIEDPSCKISAYIKSHQLKAAYLIAVKLGKTEDIRKILAEAEKLGQVAIKNICLKRLGLDT